MHSSAGLIVIIFGMLAYLAVTLAVWLVRQPVSAKKAANWPVTEATIRSVRKLTIATGRFADFVIAGDFTYIVNDEYYSGRLTISRSFSTHDATPKALVDQKVQVRYNPRKPEQYSVPSQEARSFLLDPYDEFLGTEVSSTDVDTDN
jgi:hypothetical protein